MRVISWPEPIKVESEQFLHLDVLRFFAAVAIVFHHWKTSLVLPASCRGYLSRADVLVMAVDLFFIISGIVIGAVYSSKVSSPQQIRHFLWRRAARLVPLHLLTLAVVLAVGYGTGIAKLAPLQFDLRQLPLNLLLLNALPFLHTHLAFNIVVWSISAEIFCYALFPLLIRANLPAKWLVLPAALYLVLFAIRPKLYFSMTHFPLLRAMPAFAFGVALAGRRHHLPKVIFGGYAVLAIVAVGLLCALRGMSFAYLFVLPYLVATAALSADVYARQNWFTRSTAPLGQLTYSIYMWHIPLALPFFYFGLRRLPAGQQNAIVLLLVPVLAVVSYASLRWFEGPVRHAVSGLFLRGTPHRKSDRSGAALAP